MNRHLSVVIGAALVCCVSSAWAADTPAPPAPAVVVLAPVDGVAISIPTGWIACDDASNQKLGQAADPQAMKEGMCGVLKTGTAMSFGTYDPRPSLTMAVFAGVERNNPLTAEMLTGLTPAVLAAMQAATCPDVTKPFTAENAKIDSCVLAIGTLAGHTGLFYTILFTPMAGPQMQAELWAVPYGKGVLDFNIDWIKLAEPTLKPELDALKASMQLQ
jgi:hypothetical protein